MVKTRLKVWNKSLRPVLFFSLFKEVCMCVGACGGQKCWPPGAVSSIQAVFTLNYWAIFSTFMLSKRSSFLENGFINVFTSIRGTIGSIIVAGENRKMGNSRCSEEVLLGIFKYVWGWGIRNQVESRLLGWQKGSWKHLPYKIRLQTRIWSWKPIVKGENLLLKIVFWPVHVHCGKLCICACVHAHTHTH